MCFYVERTSPVRPMSLERAPGFKALAPRARERRRHLSGRRRARRGRRADRLARLDRRVCARPTRSCASRCARAGRERRARRGRAAARAVRTLALTDLAWALRRAPRRARASWLARDAARGRSTRARPPRCCGRAPGAIRFDAPAAGNRPGRHGLWQRPLERRRLRAGAAAAAAGARARCARCPRRRARTAARWCCRSPVEPSGPPSRRARHRRDHLRAPTPSKKGLDRVLARVDVACGAPAEELARRRRRASASCDAPGIELPERGRARRPGCSRASEYRALLRRARVFVCAPRREDYGHRPARGARRRLPARQHARARPLRGAADRARARPAAGRRGLARALRTALDDPPPDYAAARARARSRRSRREAVDRLVAEQLLPRLLALARCAARGQRPRVGHLARRSATRAARWRRPSACSRACPCGGRRSRSRSARPRARRARAWTSERSRRSGLALISSIVPRARGRGEHRVEVDRVGLAALDQPARGVADRVHQRVLDRRDHALGHRLLAHPERRVHARDHPVELARAARPRSRASRRAGC